MDVSFRLFVVVVWILLVYICIAESSTTLWGSKFTSQNGIRLTKQRTRSVVCCDDGGMSKLSFRKEKEDDTIVVLDDRSPSSRNVYPSYDYDDDDDKTRRRKRRRGAQSVVRQMVHAIQPSLLGSASHYYDSDTRENVLLVSVVKKRKKMPQHSVIPKKRIFDNKNSMIEIESTTTATTTTTTTTTEEQPKDWVMDGVTQPLIPKEIWDADANVLTGTEFYGEAAMESLARTGIQMAEDSSDEWVDWTPSDKFTSDAMMEDDVLAEDMLTNGKILVWIGRFKGSGHGSKLPIVKTKSVLPLSPRSFSNLLMDSSKVQLYNKMSLGRTDEKYLIQDSDSDQEAKIVKNISKPPVSKRKLEFITFMHSRRLRPGEVTKGILGGGISSTHNDNDDELGYLVVSRAVNGGVWSEQRPIPSRGGGGFDSDSDSDGDDTDEEEDTDRLLRCEILLGVNIIRSVPGHPDKSEVTAITHVKSAKMPRPLAKKFAVSGATNFINDVRDLYDNDKKRS